MIQLISLRLCSISAMDTFHTEIVLNGKIEERDTRDVERYKTKLHESFGIPESATNFIGAGKGSVVLVFQLPLRWPCGGDGNKEIDVRARLIEDVSQRADWLMDDDVIGIHIEGQDYVDLTGFSLSGTYRGIFPPFQKQPILYR